MGWLGMELRQIRYFVTVAREANFARAAENLRIAQSGLSQQIMVLERSLGVKLFDRSVRPIRLTVEGEVFYSHARRILELADNAVDQVHAAAERRAAVLKIGGSAFGHPPLIEDVLRSARDKLPDIELRMHLDIPEHSIAALVRRELDVAFTYMPFVAEESPRYLRVGPVELIMALPSDHALAACSRISRTELARETLLLGPSNVNRPLADHVFRSLFGQTEPPRSVDLDDFGPSRFQLVAEGRGITPVAVPLEPLPPVPGVTYRRVEDPPPTFEYGFVWFDDRRSPALSEFLDVARAWASSAPASVPVEDLLRSA